MANAAHNTWPHTAHQPEGTPRCAAYPSRREAPSALLHRIVNRSPTSAPPPSAPHPQPASPPPPHLTPPPAFAAIPTSSPHVIDVALQGARSKTALTSRTSYSRRTHHSTLPAVLAIRFRPCSISFACNTSSCGPCCRGFPSPHGDDQQPQTCIHRFSGCGLCAT